MLPLLESVHVTPLLVLLAAGSIAAFTDIRDFRVPNLITLPLLVAGILFHALAPGGSGIGFALLGGLLGFSILILFYVMGGMGAGDVKLLAAVGAWVGAAGVLVLFVASALLMGLYAVILTWSQGTLRQNIFKAGLMLNQGMTIVRHLGGEERIEELVKHDDRRRRLVPYAAMVLGGIAILTLAKFMMH